MIPGSLRPWLRGMMIAGSALAVLFIGYYLIVDRTTQPAKTERADPAVSTGPTSPVPGAQAQVRLPKRALTAEQNAELAARVSQSWQEAMERYPTLAVDGEEMNSRFRFRHRALIAEDSPRLQDPAWPSQLADECAVASGIKVKAANAHATRPYPEQIPTAAGGSAPAQSLVPPTSDLTVTLPTGKVVTFENAEQKAKYQEARSRLKLRSQADTASSKSTPPQGH